MTRLSFPIVAAVLCSLLPVGLRAEENWPQFRGPTGQGVTDAAGLPVTFGEEQNVKWKTEVPGRAWSSPVVWGNQVWLSTATPDGRKLSALCLNKETGKIERDLLLFEVAAPQFAHSFNTYGSPTPVIEEGRLYVTFGSPGTACIDTATGKVLWERRDFVCNHYRGAGSSPLLYKNVLVMNFDGSDFQFVVGLDKNTGATLWRTDRSIDYQDLDPSGKPKDSGDWRKAYSTPRLLTVEGQPALVVSLGSKAFYAYEPETGKEVWRTENRDAHSGSTTPVIGKELIYTTSGMGRQQLWAIKPGGTGVVTDSHVAWKVSRNAPGKPSPVLAEDLGLIFMTDDGGSASCLDAKTGDAIWTHRIKGNYSASPLYAPADKRVYFFSEDGVATVIEASREFKQLAENTLGDGFMASAAVSGKSLLLRTRTHLYRIEAAQ